MSRVLVVCRNPECRDGVEKNPANPRPMRRMDEMMSAWIFTCDTCSAKRIVTKDQVGGTFGVGRRDDGSGTSTGKGPNRYRSLGRV